MRTRLSSHHFTRPLRIAPAVSSFGCSAPTVLGVSARRLTLALAASVPLCAGALLAQPALAAPATESDEYGPIVQIVRPGYNDVLKGKYRILIQVTARKFNPESVEMFIDDKPASTGPMPISSFASSSYDFLTTTWPEGRHKLTVRVTDSQGFRGWSETTIFINNKGVVDTQTPDLRWLGIEPFQEVSGAVKLELDATDNFGVKMLMISISSVDSPGKPVYSTIMNQPPYRVNIDTIGKNIPDGLYIAKATAWDSLDQQGEAAALTFGVLNDQINATRVEDMLEGQRQMARVIKGQAPEATAPTTQAAPTTVAPDEVITEAAPYAAPAPRTQVDAPATTKSEVTAPTAQDRLVASRPTLSAPVLSAPNANIAEQAPANPGIQVPLVTIPRAPRAQTTAPQQANGARVAQATPGEMAPQLPVGVETTTEVDPETVSERATVEAPVAVVKVPEETRVAKALPVGQRSRGEATLSRAAAVDLAIAPASQVTGERGAPIAISRFGRPQLAGRAIADSPVWSQNAASAQSRLSNAELSRLRAGKLNAPRAARQISALPLNASKAARTLQTSAPVAAKRPVPSRANSELLATPTTKLTQQAQAATAAKPVGTLSKAVTVGKRPQPIAPKVETSEASTRSAIAQAAPSNEGAQPLDIAPEFLAKNVVKPGAQAPQMSAPAAPRMSESASGLGVPAKLSQAAPRLAGQGQNKTKATLDGQRVAAQPRPGAVRRDRSPGSASIVAVPLSQSLQIAAPTAFAIPESYRAENTTTLRAIAARFGLPVELVAISNNWTSDMKVFSGMEVKLPRPLEVSYNGVPVKGDAPSMLMGDTAVTAFRFMFERTGGKLEWDAANQRVIARKEGREITLNIGSNVAKVGDREVMMEIAAFLFQGRTMVPLRFFEEGMNAQVEWNPQTGRLVVAMAG